MRFGGIISDMGDLPAGEWHFRRALELSPQPQAPFLTNLADNLMKQGPGRGGGRVPLARLRACSERPEDTDFMVGLVRGAWGLGTRDRAS